MKEAEKASRIEYVHLGLWANTFRSGARGHERMHRRMIGPGFMGCNAYLAVARLSGRQGDWRVTLNSAKSRNWNRPQPIRSQNPTLR